ncbi:PAS domain S-box protein [candidate division KSB1 bacterium]
MNKPTYEELEKQVKELKKTIVENKQVINALKFSDQVPLGVIEWDLDFRVVDWNPSAEKIFGYKKNEALGKHANELIVPEDIQPYVDEIWSDLLTSKGGLRSTNENVTKDGIRILCEWYNTPMINNSGTVIGVVSSVQDITESRRIETERQKSEEKYRDLTDTLPLVIFEIDINGILTYVNNHAFKLFGYTKTDFEKGMSAFDMIDPDDRDIAVKNFKRVMSGDYLGEREYTAIKKDGSRFKVVLISKQIIIEDRPAGLRGFLIDISERKRAESIQRVLYNILDASIRSENLEVLLKRVHSEVDTLMDAKNFYVAQYDKESDMYSFLYFSDELDTIETNVPMKLSRGVTDYVRRKNEPYLLDKTRMHKLIESDEMVIISSKSESWMGVPLLSDGDTIGVVAVQSYTKEDAYSDQELYILTYVSGHIAMAIERKQAEERLFERDAHLRAFFSNAAVGIVVADTKGNYIKVNDHYLKMFGYEDEADLFKLTVGQVTYPEDRPATREAQQKLTSGEIDIFRGEKRYIRKDGSIFWGVLSVSPIKKPNEEIGAFIAIIIDVTESKRAEKELIDSEKKFRNVVESSPMGMHFYEFNSNRELIFTGANPMADSILGVDNKIFVGKTIEEAFPPLTETEIPDRYREVATTGNLWKTEQISYEDKNIKGAYEVYAFQTTPGSMVAMFLDITERKIAEGEKQKLEEQLFQSQKMESIGRLAGGVAHDFNNILTGIMGYSELLKLRYADTSSKEGFAADVIFTGATRAADLTKQLLGFARGGKYNPNPININTLIEDTVRVSEKIFEKNIKVEYDFEENINTVEADENQINQVLTNLIINAKDAMPHGGRLTFKTENINIKYENRNVNSEVKTGSYVKISIIDNGVGMTKKVKDSIFEPFFSTKGKGKGTGLGLATVYGIIKNHNGHIDVYSEPGEGTLITLWLPKSGKKIMKERTEKPVIKGKATILVVDDEEHVRDLSKEILERLGYKIYLAGDGKDAVRVYNEKKDEIDLVLLDMVMPEMAGRETNFELRKINPDIRILLASGYSQNETATEILSEGVIGFIQKPFSILELSKAVSEALKK